MSTAHITPELFLRFGFSQHLKHTARLAYVVTMGDDGQGGG